MPGDTIVAISPDLGEKYLDTVYDPAWVEKVIAAEGKKSLRTTAYSGELNRGICARGKSSRLAQNAHRS